VAARPAAPVLVLDLLSTFMDESVQLQESTHLFVSALQHLQSVGQTVPVVVSAKPLLSLSAPRLGLLQQLKEAAAEVWEETDLPSVNPVREVQLPLLLDY